MPFVIVNGKVIVDATGSSIMLPILLSENGPILPIIDYCLTVRRSISWTNKLLRAIKLFLEYLEANASVDEKEWRQFRNFANALRIGTIDNKTRCDPSGLYWIPVKDASQIINLLSDFFDWLGRDQSPRSAKFNPKYTGNFFDQRIELEAYEYRRGKARSYTRG